VSRREPSRGQLEEVRVDRASESPADSAARAFPRPLKPAEPPPPSLRGIGASESPGASLVGRPARSHGGAAPARGRRHADAARDDDGPACWTERGGSCIRVRVQIDPSPASSHFQLRAPASGQWRRLRVLSSSWAGSESGGCHASVPWNLNLRGGGRAAPGPSTPGRTFLGYCGGGGDPRRRDPSTALAAAARRQQGWQGRGVGGVAGRFKISGPRWVAEFPITKGST
jgi:hypothetical protein